MNVKMNHVWTTAGCFALALIGAGCGGNDVTGPDSTPTVGSIEWTQNGLQMSYTDPGFGIDLTTTPNRFSLGVGQEGSDITILGFSVPFAVGRYTIDASAEMDMGRPGCDVYVAGPNDGGSGWIEITKIETAAGFPAVIEGRFEVTLVADGYCPPSSGPERVCIGSYIASAWELPE
jgi:hypothetical protein